MFKRIFIFFVFVVFLSFQLTSQMTFEMKDTTVAECDGIHTDSDFKTFPAGHYDELENYTFTICPGVGATIYYTFTSFWTEGGIDTVNFYNGPSTASPFIAQYSGNLNGSLPPTIVANSGCLTITFHSDGSLEFPGWIANWNSTAPPVTAPTVNMSAIKPPTCDSNSFIIEFDRKLHCDSIVNATYSLLGNNAPNIVNVTKYSCTNDSSFYARVWLNTPFIFNCEYELIMNLNIPDICDSVYQFTIRDTFDFTTCNMLAQIVSSNDSICFGDCATVEVTNPTNCNTYTYAWSNGLPSTMGPHNVCPTVTTTYYVTVTETATGNQYYDSVRIKVLDTLDKENGISTLGTSEPPSCNDRWFRVKFDNSLPCYLLDSVTFTLTSTAGIFNVSNKIPLNCTNGFLDSVRLRLNAPFVQNCEYYLEFNLTFTDSCEGPITIIARDTFQITDCPFTLTTIYDDTVCLGSCTNLRAISSGCDGYTYLWSNGLPNSGGPFNICPTGDTTFTLQVTEISTGLVLNDTITIKYIDPTINPVSPICIGDPSINLSAQTAGGSWSGNGITNSSLGTFDPSSAGAGTHSIIYSINSCTDTVQITVIQVNARSNRNWCASGIPRNLPNGLPVGGVWSGTYVNSATSQFTPTVYGNFTAYYTVNGCTDSINIFVDTIAFGYDTDTICGSSPPFNIPFTPPGGNWSGTGITSGANGTFDPSLASNGSNLVNYFYKGCRDTVNIVVVAVNAGPDTNACPSQSPFNLATGFPAGGIWSGTGITNTAMGTFNPGATIGNWTDTVFYTFGGCPDSLIVDVIQTNISADTLFTCPSQDSIPINSITGLNVNPNYGIWSGNGVQIHGGVYYLYPRFLGNGYHTIFYDKNTCQDSVIIGIYPDSLSYQDTTICSTHPSFKLDSINNMPGATWTGTGITNSSTGEFDPSVSGNGTHTITYNTIGGVCNKTIDVTVYQFVAANITFPDTVCYTNANTPITVVPAAGTWSGTGNYNQTTGVFNPAVAGTGSHQVIYTFGTGVCQTSDTKNIWVRDSLTISLTASPDSICLGSSSTLTGLASGGNPSPNYQYTWSHTASTSNSDIVSPNTTTQYILTLNDGCSDPSSDTVTVTVLEVIPNLITSPIQCFGNLGFATYDLTQKPIYNFNWTNPPSTADTVFAMGFDSVFLTVSNNYGCSVDTFMVIPSYADINADFDLNPDIFPKCLSSDNKTLVVTDRSTGAVTGSWDFDDGNVLPYIPSNSSETNTYADGGNYTITLIVKNNGPCYDTLTKDICVSDQVFFIADIFSPNGDGINDILYVRSFEAEKLIFRVFDRWGKLVFESTDVDNGWDGTYQGKKLESGVYFYSVEMTITSGEEFLEKGDVTLKR
ncbi:MAG: gliding motility-associated C-terminal domain-containing protein [Flavobacteriales bacterium]